MGMVSFRFLVTGDLSLFRPFLHDSIRAKSFPLIELSLDETTRYFEGILSDIETLQEIHNLTRALPSRLASVRRLIASGADPKQFVTYGSQQRSELFEMEWRTLSDTDDKQKKIVALLCHDEKSHTLTSISTTLGLNREEVQALLTPLTFIRLDVSSSEKVSFVSEAFRRYAAEKLNSLKRSIHKLLINKLLEDPTSDESILLLPKHMEEAHEYQDLLTFLTSDHILQVLLRSQTLSRVQETVQSGMRISKKLERDSDLLRFSIQNAVIGELARSGVWASEMQALVALGRDEEALVIANNTVLLEDRLHLLSAIAHTRRFLDKEVTQDLLDQIIILLGRIDKKVLGSRGLAIARNLVCIAPEPAIDLAEQCSERNATEEQKDQTYFDLSLAALRSSKNDDRFLETIESLRSHRKTRQMELFSEAATLLLCKLGANEVIKQVNRLERESDRLRLLRIWLLSKSTDPEAAYVLEFALTLAIQTTSYTIDATALRELSTPLLSLTDKVAAKRIIGILDGVRGNAHRLGPSIDYVRFQIQIAYSEVRYDAEACQHRLLELFNDLKKLQDLTTRAECAAWILEGLVGIDPQYELPLRIEMEKELTEELDTAFCRLLDATADHTIATRDIISALAINHFEKALEFALMLNTEQRRDSVLLDLIEAMLNQPLKALSVTALRKAFDEFSNREYRNEALRSVLTWLDSKVNCDPEIVANFIPLIATADQVRDSVLRCRCCLLGRRFLLANSSATQQELSNHLSRTLLESWKSIDIGWIRINIGFEIAKDLAKISPDEARKYLEQTEQYRAEWQIAAYAPAAAYVSCLRLATRAFSGLLPRNLNTEEDLSKIEQLIDALPSYGMRATVWADLAMRCAHVGHLCEEISQKHIWPCLDLIPEKDKAYGNRVLVSVAPALYKAHAETCLEALNVLPLPYKDIAYRNIVEFLMRQQPPSDPEDSIPKQGYDITYSILISVCNLLSQMDTDSGIYYWIEQIADSLLAKKNELRINNPQRLDISRRLEEIATTKLPSTRHIKHNGFRIIALAQVYRIRRAKVDDWKTLILQGYRIPNDADKALVLTTLATSLPASLDSEQKRLIRDAEEIIDKIPLSIDRLARYLKLATDVSGIDQSLSRDTLKKAMHFVSNANQETEDYHRSIVDLAYRIDPDFAQSLVDVVDDDVARKYTKQRLALLNTRKTIIDEKMPAGDLDLTTITDFRSLGSLLVSGLKSGRIAHFHSSLTRGFLEAAAAYPLRNCYNALTWVIENAIARFANTNEAPMYLRPMFDATLVGAHLAGRISGQSLLQLKSIKSQIASAVQLRIKSVPAGTRENVMRFFQDWFSSNVKSAVTICDQYFGLEDLSIVALLLSIKPAVSVNIMTSRRHQPVPPNGMTLDELYISHWRLHISDQSPPETIIYIIGTEPGGESPIHDRWIVTEESGLILGTSFNSLGKTKDSAITVMSDKEAETRRIEIDQYLTRTKKEINGLKLRLTTFTL